ncbi:phage tail domain-containing protein [Staphylococcus carnosus]|uniref:phage tail domain-containing protein n=1 Tax=Staphylococcus carnosus TaxID=1281 RepID=UPI000CD2E119|nr:phage tail domain-containing protein [Staphylococcus carnosus]PNZ96743.1 phage tail protein [Staphylococcus carnosus]QRQ05445.1 phage tail family protein [Staphylococcus carnosus]UTB82552.1 phage tail protein [Staphylococcus carnosus]SUM06962.1 phage tail family protein [Staphylococcus carnosus]GEP80675.1 holin [Staphylococcus carnosus]
MKKEVRLFNDNFDVKLTDTPNLLFLDHTEEDVEVNANTTEINGTDGVLMGPTSFGPFNLVLNFSFKGLDTKDLKLYKQKIRNILYQREPYYVWHSDVPGKKYAVYCDSNDNDDLTNSFATFEVTFVVFKGYSESLKDTSQFSLSSGDWQFEAGVLSDDEVKYTHDTTAFKIYNGSSDTINPLLRHKLKVLINLNAPKGFKIKNTTTGDVFEYKKAIKSNQRLTLDGVHPFINNKRVGIDTNWQWLTLDEGFNDIEIIGENISNVQTQWVFPFIYR